MHCAGFGLNKHGCFSCLPYHSQWNDAQCSYMSQPKGCTEHGLCLLCPPGATGHADVVRKIESVQFSQLQLYVSASCHHFEKKDIAAHTIATNAWPKLKLRAHDVLNVYGPASLGHVDLEAPSVSVSDMHFLGPAYVKAQAFTGNNLYFANHDDALIFHDSSKLDGKVTGLSSMAGPAVGAIDCNGGTITLQNCITQNDKLATPFIMVQDSALQLLKPLVLSVSGETCKSWTLINASHEFDLFSKEYEVRYFNHGYYQKHEGFNTTYVLVVSGIIVVLILTLPMCHQAIWNSLFAALTRRHTSKNK